MDNDHGEYKYQQLKEDPDSFVNQKDDVMDKEFEEFMLMLPYKPDDAEWKRMAAAYNFAKQLCLDKAVEVANEIGYTLESGEAHLAADKIKKLKK